MTDPIASSIDRPERNAPTRLTNRLLRRAALQRLEGITRGNLNIVDSEGQYSFGQASANFPLHSTVTVHHPSTYTRIALRGCIGAGEGYMAGEWSCDDLTTLMRIFVLNRRVMFDLEDGIARFAVNLWRLIHALRGNTRRGSRSNIAAHYDLGNEFYELFLDQTMMYSCAIFPTKTSDLFAASVAKNERICQKLKLCPQDHLLEIGTGWGGFALHAATRYGCRVTTTTISKKQYALAQERVRAAGLEDRVTVLLSDYRDLRGSFDKLVSIEMIEAVGHRYFDAYFQTCSRLLKPDGMMLLQGITITDQYYEEAKKFVDFIQYYIFPGGCLPSLTAITASVSRVSDLRLLHLEDIGLHYATTLSHWRKRFLGNLDKVRAQNFSETFIRMWEFYLCYCEGGFMERAVSAAQILFVKPENRCQPPLPDLS